MAKQDFLNNLRTARTLFFHPRVETGSASMDHEALERMRARAAVWLTPKSVKGFSAADFPELGLDRQRELQMAVKDFLEVAAQVPPNELAPPEQLSNARAAFQKILALLQPCLPAPVEEEAVEKALQNVEFRPPVVNWDFELGDDHDGIPAVWINLFADDNLAPRKEFGRLAMEMTRRIHQALSAAGNSRWPYVRVRSPVEHKTV